MRWALTSVVLVFAAVFATAQANVRINPGERTNRNAEYRQAVANYCRFDYDGARLTPETWTRLQPLTAWRENPEYRRIAVVSRYQILPDMVYSRGRYVFQVQYDISGEYDLTGGYFPEAMRVSMEIAVGEQSGDTRVLEISEPRPFVGRARLMQWLQAKLNTETDPASKATLQASLQRLQDEIKKPIPGQ